MLSFHPALAARSASRQIRILQRAHQLTGRELARLLDKIDVAFEGRCVTHAIRDLAMLDELSAPSLNRLLDVIDVEIEHELEVAQAPARVTGAPTLTVHQGGRS
jgi:hypothetical protein